MSDIALDAYLFFEGNCREAMEFYMRIFGGELEVQTYGDAPGTDEADKDKVIHAKLEGGEIKLMASDTSLKDELGTGKIQLSLGGTDELKLREIFGSLSSDGRIKRPLQKEFWGDT